jgi:hypothetical protein
MNLLNQCVFFTSHESIIRVAIFSQCVSLIEFNRWEDQCLNIIKKLQKKKEKRKNCKKPKVAKKGRMKKRDPFCDQFTNGYKLTIEMGNIKNLTS